MLLMRHEEKRLHLLEKLGAHLRSQRQAVFRETPDEFSHRLALFGARPSGARLVVAMENGSPDVSIGDWMCAWQVMQVADAVAGASKSEAALFLAAAQAEPGIEEEMASQLNKPVGDGGSSI